MTEHLKNKLVLYIERERKRKCTKKKLMKKRPLSHMGSKKITKNKIKYNQKDEIKKNKRTKTQKKLSCLYLPMRP